MRNNKVNRRTVVAGAAALAAASVAPRRTMGQGAARPGSTLPARGEFVVRGAHVLSMDASIGDLPSGDVHVRNGAIVAVAASVAAPGARGDRRHEA